MTTTADRRIRGSAVPVLPPRPRRLFRRLIGQRAQERVFRVLCFAFLPGSVVFGALGALNAVDQADAWPAWWTMAAFAAGVLPSVVLGVTAFVLPIHALRLIARVSVGCTLLGLASIPFVAIPGASLRGPIWFANVCGLGIIAAAVAARPAGAIWLAVAGGALNVIARTSVGGPLAFVTAAQTGLYVLLFTITFIALGVSSLAAAAAADEAEAAAEEATADAAADAARERERARINALVHDRVLATLLMAARQIPESEALERRDAARALEGLHALLRDEPVSALTGERFAWQVQAITTELLPEALFNYEVDGDADVPGDAVDALLEAVEEAMRNSVRHAGQANHTVHVRVDDHGAEIDVLDDGVGFEREAVPPGRLGISESIEGRMRALTGGSALVISQPGVGTRVTLRWRAR